MNSMRLQSLKQQRQIGVCKDIELLFLDDDLRSAWDFVSYELPGVVICSEHQRIWSEQSGGRFGLTRSPDDAVRLPGFEFSVILSMSVSGGKNQDAVCGGKARKRGERRDEHFGSGDSKRSGRKKKVKLGIDVEKDGAA